MGRLTRSVCAGLLAMAVPAHADEVGRWRPIAEEASRRFAVPVDWIERVMHAESRGRTHLNGAPIVSRAGAMGLMQLMPGTWADMRARLGLGPDPHDPRDNILAGSLYLRLMYDQFGYPGLFAAYNAGPARYADHLATGRLLPAETRAYAAAVSRDGRVGVRGDMAAGDGASVRRDLPQRGSGIFFALSGGAPAENRGAGGHTAGDPD